MFCPKPANFGLVSLESPLGRLNVTSLVVFAFRAFVALAIKRQPGRSAQNGQASCPAFCRSPFHSMMAEWSTPTGPADRRSRKTSGITATQVSISSLKSSM